MPKRTTDFREDLLADLVDPQEAANYLNAALEDSGQMALAALRDVAEARQMARVAESAGVAREALYRMLRSEGNPTYSSLMGVLDALGLKIVFAPSNPNRRSYKRAKRADRPRDNPRRKSDASAGPVTPRVGPRSGQGPPRGRPEPRMQRRRPGRREGS